MTRKIAVNVANFRHIRRQSRFVYYFFACCPTSYSLIFFPCLLVSFLFIDTDVIFHCVKSAEIVIPVYCHCYENREITPGK